MNRNEKQNSVSLMIVRLCFVLSLWQGPVPWLHCHESEFASPASNVELRHHLAIFHDGAVLDQDHDFGWHFHWILPNWSQVFHASSHDEQPAKDLASLDSIVVSSTIPTSIDRLFEGELCQHCALPKSIVPRCTNRRIGRGHRPRRNRDLPLVLRC